MFGTHTIDTKKFHFTLATSLMGSSQPSEDAGDSRVDAAANAFINKMREIDRMSGEQQQLVMHAATSKMASETPKALFLLLPLFALFFKLAFFRRYYAFEAFVFTLHLHAFAFLAFVPRIFVAGVWLHQFAAVVGLTATLIYGAIALERFYQPTLTAGVVKVLLIGAAYTVTLGAVDSDRAQSRAIVWTRRTSCATHTVHADHHLSTPCLIWYSTVIANVALGEGHVIEADARAWRHDIDIVTGFRQRAGWRCQR